ncbi:MAG: hypothetical protein J0M34_08560 [Alphaproteobacteria bacterium]|nr:hypothetical protein [Alphaproteobacteria bacterium]
MSNGEVQDLGGGNQMAVNQIDENTRITAMLVPSNGTVSLMLERTVDGIPKVETIGCIANIGCTRVSTIEAPPPTAEELGATIARFFTKQPGETVAHFDENDAREALALFTQPRGRVR